MAIQKPVVLVILDGWGISSRKKANAIELGKTENYHSFWRKFPHAILKASGEAVGLPPGYQGNSEVGHLNIGAGRVVHEELVRINKSIEDGSFFMNKKLIKAIDNAKESGGNIHLMGLLQDQGVHAHQDHLFALLNLIGKKGMSGKTFVHIFTDGRDTHPKSAMVYINELKKRLGKARIGVVVGRYYAMDRDRRWQRAEIAYNGLVNCAGKKVKDVDDAIKDAYRSGESDEFIKPRIIEGYPGIDDGDSVIYYNYRLDRGREITRAFVDESFPYFDREKLDITYVAFEEYYKGLEKGKVLVAFEQRVITNNLGKVIADNGLKQFRTAETEKYAHVTFFFNSQVEEPNKNEDRMLVQSPKVATYDLQPEMSAPEVCKNVLDAVKSGKYDLIVVNFANSDMVGHTGMLKAAIKAVEVVDECIGKIAEAVQKRKGIAIITADHGNSEQMENEDGSPCTSHTTNDVPFILIGRDLKLRQDEDCKLADIAPTILELLEIRKPKEMTGKSLIK